MKKSLLLLLLVAGCGGSGQPDGNEANRGREPAAADRSGKLGPPGTSPLTGLYEGASADRPDQLCIVEKASGDAQFGLVIWGSNMHSCSGAGDAVREGSRLKLAMAGDQECAFDAEIRDGTIRLPTTLPSGCSYYCGARAQMSGASFARKGTSIADAMQAKDLVGEPLCAGMAPTD